ncbi:hypothetical protein CBR_g22377 [Chara braunii]|uniref:Cyclin N-terminal domain-containing protein n=1 Tax=Chara braunii TaxID=69332 RepID=A0A388JUX8_CHABU|nr:hypothetical protein CBR_g22377 [Chara braunii]|eukprot:GBG61580.1 hypothetical protein CBR_g22377 [Chara braunii]
MGRAVQEDRPSGTAKGHPLWQRKEAGAADGTRRVSGVMTRAQKRKACLEESRNDDGGLPSRGGATIAHLAGRWPGSNKVARICPPDPSSRPSFMEEAGNFDGGDCEEHCYPDKPGSRPQPDGACENRGPTADVGRQKEGLRLPADKTVNEPRAAAMSAAADRQQACPRRRGPSLSEPGKKGLANEQRARAASSFPPPSRLAPSRDEYNCRAAGARGGPRLAPGLSLHDQMSNTRKSRSDGGCQTGDADRRLRLRSDDAKEGAGIGGKEGTRKSLRPAKSAPVVEVGCNPAPNLQEVRQSDATTQVRMSCMAGAAVYGGQRDATAQARRSGVDGTAAGNGGGLRTRQGVYPPLRAMIGKWSSSGQQQRGIPTHAQGLGTNATGTTNRRPIATESKKGHGVYDEDIFQNLLLREKGRRCPGYLGTSQPDIHSGHRKVLVNWLVEFSEEFGLQIDTVFRGVAIMDRCLADGPAIRRQKLQLLGVASMLVASKYEETKTPTMILKDSCEVTDPTFTPSLILKMEATVLKILHFDCAMPTVMTFLWHFLRAAKADKRMERTAEHIACLSMLDDGLLASPPSLIAAAVVFLASHTLMREPWSKSMTDWSGYSASDLRQCVERLHAAQMDKEVRTGILTAIWDKYSAADHLSVALLPPSKSLPACLYKKDEDLSAKANKR